ncbi:hypothetical protein KPH14_007500 [Odynerus spinipes]|uniref:Uncharacterized protein n=1 Tax=Odynerus spinipes TaxID=1348599 RepID=A0AAD9VIT2_9HYME|nr:hypothetical protein KPH14_007500 [Odynerus spinipes]
MALQYKVTEYTLSELRRKRWRTVADLYSFENTENEYPSEREICGIIISAWIDKNRVDWKLKVHRIRTDEKCL